MYKLREHIATITSEADRVDVFDWLLLELRRLGYPVLRESKEEGTIVVQFLTLLVNAVLWRCWADKLLLHVGGTERKGTIVNIYAIPNLFRLGAKKSERAQDVGLFLQDLRSSLSADRNP